MKFNAFLHPNEHPERICSYLVRQFEAELAKIGHFQISESILEAKYDSIFLRSKFLFEYQIRRTIFIKSIYFFNHSCKTLFSKNVPYFCQLCLKLSYKIQTNPFRMFIRVQKCIEFHLPPYKIPQLWSHYCTFMNSLRKALQTIMSLVGEFVAHDPTGSASLYEHYGSL